MPDSPAELIEELRRRLADQDIYISSFRGISAFLAKNSETIVSLLDRLAVAVEAKPTIEPEGAAVHSSEDISVVDPDPAPADDVIRVGDTIEWIVEPTNGARINSLVEAKKGDRVVVTEVDPMYPSFYTYRWILEGVSSCPDGAFKSEVRKVQPAESPVSPAEAEAVQERAAQAWTAMEAQMLYGHLPRAACLEDEIRVSQLVRNTLSGAAARLDAKESLPTSEHT